MNNSSQNKGFKYGFTLGLVLMFFAQLITFYDVFASVQNPSPEIVTHRAWDIGFPFSMYSGWFLRLSNGEPDFNGFVVNLIYAGFFSIALGLIFRFKNNIQNSLNDIVFVIGFIGGIICFLFLNYSTNIVINIDSYHFRLFGFPFKFIEFGNVNTRIVWRVLIADILTGIIFSLLIGLIFKFVWSKIAARKLS